MKEVRLKIVELLVRMASRNELSEDRIPELLAKAEILSQYIEQGIRQPEEKPVKRRKSRGLNQV